ncbi:FRG domain-containing protein [Halomonas pacifica]|uniref:FRG domain-containing protein n=1 Tax=Bisbaumannia pacifica TaxID=77098 RepID=UPI002358D271|nr:FRG domain-containing protein [Halomonas pacifica]MDC8804201.1 FRG domain-containing protein [Halomonas pacifica]
MPIRNHMLSEKIFESANDLLEYLNPLDTERWPPEQHIFRGQPDSDLQLLPSSHRTEGAVTAPKRWGSKSLTCGDQVQFEQEVLQHFIAACDSSGLPIPGDSQHLRCLVDDPTQRLNPQSWPPQEIHHALAFAQHHGVPTCLLDWSRRSYVAAYFAASSALAGEPKEGQRIAIWALDRRSSDIRVIEAPGSTSPNLAAQSGVFTESPISSFFNSRLPVDESTFFPVGLQHKMSLYEKSPKTPVIEVFTLPIEQAGSLLKGCELLGVSGTTLFPGYEGISRKVRDWANTEHAGYDPGEITPRDLL